MEAGVDIGPSTRDKVFLLSLEEVSNPAYGFCEDSGSCPSANRQRQGSEYCKAVGGYSSSSEGYECNLYWWLRTKGYYNDMAAMVMGNGVATEQNGVCSRYMVVPALRIDLSATDVYTVTEKEEETEPQSETALPQTREVTVDNNLYRITSDASGTVTDVVFVKTTDKKATEITIDTVKVDGVKLTVTEIAAAAFKNNKKLTKLVIGSSVKKIGKSAFYGCKKLASVTIKTTKLTSKKVGAYAFKNISSKAVIKVPAKKLSAYKKLLKNKGVFGKNQKITK